MKEKLIDLVKNNRIVYLLYYYFMSTVLFVLKLFVGKDNHLILFVSYGGRYFNDSPRCLYKAMVGDSRFSNYKLVWAFREPSNFPDIENRVKIDSLSYYITALKAKCWITNVYIERGLNFKSKHTFYLNTAHGNIPKLGWTDVDPKTTFLPKKCTMSDAFLVQSEFEKNNLKGKEDNAFLIGLPKNDVLANYTEEERQSLRYKLGVPQGKKVILYAPTYREGELMNRDVPIDFKKWETVLGDEYIVWFRAHPVFACKVNVDSTSGFVFNMSSYPENNDLMIAADVLISDYSAITSEFGIQEKPMFCYAYDYDDYNRTRGLYFDVREALPGGYMNEEELINYIKNGDKEEIMSIVHKFRDKYIQAYGHATEKCLDLIYNNINKE